MRHPIYIYRLEIAEYRVLATLTDLTNFAYDDNLRASRNTFV